MKIIYTPKVFDHQKYCLDPENLSDECEFFSYDDWECRLFFINNKLEWINDSILGLLPIKCNICKKLYSDAVKRIKSVEINKNE